MTAEAVGVDAPVPQICGYPKKGQLKSEAAYCLLNFYTDLEATGLPLSHLSPLPVILLAAWGGSSTGKLPRGRLSSKSPDPSDLPLLPMSLCLFFPPMDLDVIELS